MQLNMDGFDKMLDELESKTPGTVNKFVSMAGEELVSEVKMNTPVDTGRLRAAWHRTPTADGKTEVYNNTAYVNHVEYGHRQRVGRFVPAIGKRLKQGFVPGKKMLHRSMGTFESEFQDIASAAMKELMKS
jgi:hypothetical protein